MPMNGARQHGDPCGVRGCALDDLAICPTGKSLADFQELRVQSLAQKYSTFAVGQITALNPRVSRRMRGGSRSSRTLRWDAVDV